MRFSDMGALVRHHRAVAGWTQAELAARSGLSVRTVRNVETGRMTQARLETLRCLLATLGSSEQVTNVGLARVQTAMPEDSAVEVLGPMRLFRNGVAVEVTSERLRRMLGMLALHCGQPVTRDQLIDLMWDGRPPGTYAALLNTYVARLRGLLEPERSPGRPATTVVRTATGYALRLDQHRLDLARFEQVSRQGLTALADGQASVAAHLLGEALDVWRGPPVTDIPLLAQHPAAIAIAQRRIAIAIAYADVALGCLEYDLVAERLRRVLFDEQLHERLHARLLLALAGSGQQAAAVKVLTDLRARLRTDLGVEPGVEVHTAYLQVLRQSVPDGVPRAFTAPSQLPADVPTFVGRGDVLKRLDALVATDATGPRVFVLSGTAGVGKTTLAVHWAHRMAALFPDGLLYVNLRGFDPSGTPRVPGHVVADFLEALGVSPGRMPAGQPAREVLYRTLMNGRRVLVVLDNARDADQALPLLPGSVGPVVVVTSRGQLTSLVVAGAHPIGVDLLTEAEATDLLAARLGAHRVDRETTAVRQIVQRCARLPLALSIAAARATVNPGFSLGFIARELGETRGGLDVFDGGDTASNLRGVFASSRRNLAPSVARVFALLGACPGPDIAVSSAARLTGLSRTQAGSALAVLARAHLMVEYRPGRFTMHDLLRRYAAELANTLSVTDRLSALSRLVEHLVGTAWRASALIEGRRVAPTGEDSIDTPAQALAWYADERPLLMAALDRAADSGMDGQTCQLALALTELFERQGHWQDWAWSTSRALRAAQRLGDLELLARLHRCLARAQAWLTNWDSACQHLERALALYSELGNRAGVAHTHRIFCVMLGYRGQYQAAVVHARSAVRLFDVGDDPAGLGLSYNALGWHLAKLGLYPLARQYCARAVVLLRRAGDNHGSAVALDSLGYIRNRQGNPGAAAVHYREAIALFRRTGSRYREAETMRWLGDVHHHNGDYDKAEHAWQRAFDVFDELRHPAANQVRARLDHGRLAGHRG